MKKFIVEIEYLGLTGAYRSQIEVRAKDSASAAHKARKHFGNRDGAILSLSAAGEA